MELVPFNGRTPSTELDIKKDIPFYFLLAQYLRSKRVDESDREYEDYRVAVLTNILDMPELASKHDLFYKTKESHVMIEVDSINRIDEIIGKKHKKYFLLVSDGTLRVNYKCLEAMLVDEKYVPEFVINPKIAD